MKIIKILKKTFKMNFLCRLFGHKLEFGGRCVIGNKISYEGDTDVYECVRKNCDYIEYVVIKENVF